MIGWLMMDARIIPVNGPGRQSRASRQYCANVTDDGPELSQCHGNPENARRPPNAFSMLGHRLRRWHNNEQALDECLVFACEAMRRLDMVSQVTAVRL